MQGRLFTFRSVFCCPLCCLSITNGTAQVSFAQNPIPQKSVAQDSAVPKPDLNPPGLKPAPNPSPSANSNPKKDHLQEAAIFDRILNRVRFENDGTDVSETEAVVQDS